MGRETTISSSSNVINSELISQPNNIPGRKQETNDSKRKVEDLFGDIDDIDFGEDFVEGKKFIFSLLYNFIYFLLWFAVFFILFQKIFFLLKVTH